MASLIEWDHVMPRKNTSKHRALFEHMQRILWRLTLTIWKKVLEKCPLEDLKFGCRINSWKEFYVRKNVRASWMISFWYYIALLEILLRHEKPNLKKLISTPREASREHRIHKRGKDFGKLWKVTWLTLQSGSGNSRRVNGFREQLPNPVWWWTTKSSSAVLKNCHIRRLLEYLPRQFRKKIGSEKKENISKKLKPKISDQYQSPRPWRKSAETKAEMY